MKKVLTNNLGLKLLSVVAAIMLWLIVMNIDDPYTYRDFSPIQVTMLNEDVVTDQGKVYKIEDGSDVISIRVWGKKSVLRELEITDFTATADMQKSIKYNDLVGIEVSCSNKNVRSADINLSRENVVISVEDASSEQFNVVVKQSGKVADGYMIGTALPEQSLIQISGPASVIAKIKRVEVEIKTTGVNSDRTIHGKLNVLNSDGETVDTTYLEYIGKTDGMDVAITMLRTKTVPLSVGHTGTPADGYSFNSISYKPETVVIAGTAEVISKIASLTIPDEAVNIDGISENQQQTIDISQYLPEGVRLADETDSSIAVSVEIEKKQGKTITIPVSRIGLQNVPKGMEVDFDDVSSVELVIMGTSSQLAQLDTDAIAVTLDVDGHTKAGTYTGTLNVTLPDSEYSLMREVELEYSLVKRTAATENKTTESGESSRGTTDTSGNKTEDNTESGSTGTGTGSSQTGNNTPGTTSGTNGSGETTGENQKNDSATE